jgi:hypothetical protein
MCPRLRFPNHAEASPHSDTVQSASGTTYHEHEDALINKPLRSRIFRFVYVELRRLHKSVPLHDRSSYHRLLSILIVNAL